jgi:hypothetical protein
MISLALALLAAEPSCDAPLTPPKIPQARDFKCPSGTELIDKEEGAIGCRRKDGVELGDLFFIDAEGGVSNHDDGPGLTWENGRVTSFGDRKAGKPVGVQAVFDALGKLKLVSIYDASSQLICARRFLDGRLIKRFDRGAWTWLDARGQPLGKKTPLGKDEIMVTIQEHNNEVKFCYEKRLQEVKGDLRGKVTASFLVTDGDVSNLKFSEDTLHDPGVTDCMLQRINKWKFRPASEPTEINFPWVFKPAEAP